VLKTMVIEPGGEDKPAFELPVSDRLWVGAMALANVVPLLFWAGIEQWTRGSLAQYAGR
jgi:hypothetical protein